MSDLSNFQNTFLSADSSLASLGFWQFHFDTGLFELSTEAARLYALPTVSKCSLEQIKQKIFCEDKSRYEDSWQAALAGELHDIEYRIQHHDGRIIWLWEKAQLVLNEHQQVVFAHGIVQDISRHRAMCENLSNIANHDRLTGLPNRKLLAEHLSVAIPLAQRNKWTLAVLFIDLDKFKQVNDGLGHEAGDELLRQVATRMKQCLRNSDLVARQGGDEFIVVLQNAGSDSDVGLSALSIIEQLSRPFNLNGPVAHIGASIGVTMLSPNIETVDELFHQADIAMYQAKLAGRQTLVFYDPAMQSEVLMRRTLEEDLFRAISNREFVMFYQPIFRLAQHNSNQVEALLRWQHPEHGLIGPEVFMGVAESSNVINNIGIWVLEEVCRQIADWRKQGREINVSVNISARQIGEGLPIEWLNELITRYQVGKQQLTFELTEQVLLQADCSVRQWLYGIEKIGINLALEHFGTGHTSLVLLRNFNIHRIKIDKSLLSKINTDARTRGLVKSIIDIAHNMVLQVVAEGVENADTLLTLQAMGCQEAQGFHLASPMPASAISQQA